MRRFYQKLGARCLLVKEKVQASRLDYIPFKKSLIIIYNIFLGRGVTSGLTLGFRIGVSRCFASASNGLVDAQVQGNEDKLGKIGMGLMLRRGDKLGDRPFGTRWALNQSFITGVMYNPY